MRNPRFILWGELLEFMSYRLISAAVICAAMLASCGGDQTSIAESPDREKRVSNQFDSASTVEEVRNQLRKLPTDNVWWTVNGEDMAWNFKNLQRIFPTVSVYRNGPVRPLAQRPMSEIGHFQMNTPEGPMSFEAFLESSQSTAMGVVILHRGEIVFEKYPRMQEYEKPIYWSVAKVLVSTVVRILEERGEIDVGLPIDSYIRTLRNSSFSGISVRNILDMATGLDCPEEYVDWNSCYYRYSMAVGDGFRTESAPDNPYDYVASLDVAKIDEQGTCSYQHNHSRRGSRRHAVDSRGQRLR